MNSSARRSKCHAISGVKSFLDNPLVINPPSHFYRLDVDFVGCVHDCYLICTLQFGDSALWQQQCAPLNVGTDLDAGKLSGPENIARIGENCRDPDRTCADIDLILGCVQLALVGKMRSICQNQLEF